LDGKALGDAFGCVDGWVRSLREDTNGGGENSEERDDLHG